VERRAYVELGQRACLSIQQCPVPVVAGVKGYALGAGAEIALSADFVIMADDAQMGFPEVSLGTFFGGGVTTRIVELVGMSRAKEVLFLGDRFSGHRAEEWGLVYQSVPERDLESSVQALAGRLADLAPLSVALAKRIIGEARGIGVDEVMRREAKALAACMETSDWAEGVRAFAERRQPRFEGR
jgi:enoyl-CoA hydratase